jgi:hypothetical protein
MEEVLFKKMKVVIGVAKTAGASQFRVSPYRGDFSITEN